MVRMSLSGKGNTNFSLQSTISDVNLHMNQMLQACPKIGLLTSEYFIRNESVCMNY